MRGAILLYVAMALALLALADRLLVQVLPAWPVHALALLGAVVAGMLGFLAVQATSRG